MNQVFNPFLPLNEYIPDGEPHVFGGRVYLFGSHDKEGGDTFCMLDYTVWSAPVNDLKNWHCDGVIYRANQDALFSEERQYMYAPDVVQGNDGRYYLYYCLSGKYGVGGYSGVISVAVCDTPAGKYQYLGFVRNPDGTPMKRYICFDPAVMNDNGTIRLYYGTQYPFEEEPGFRENQALIQQECEMFGKSAEEILNTPESVMGASMCILENDMLTVREPAKHIIPYAVRGTDFEAHPFFEASSMRKVGQKYYFIYSSWLNHELCYAVSDYPDRDFSFGGTIVSNGDIGYRDRKPEDRLNMTGTTHGSIINIMNQWYVFYHRLTHKSDYSRQACAERINILPDGSIPQVEMTSCGLNGEPLRAEGIYPAGIACNITNGHMPHGSNAQKEEHFPHVNHDENKRFIAEISDNTLIGYKYFQFDDVRLKLRITYQSDGNGVFRVYTDSGRNQLAGEIPVTVTDNWMDAQIMLPVYQKSVRPLYLAYHGNGEVRLLEFEFIPVHHNPDAEANPNQGLFAALGITAVAVFFLAGAAFAGKLIKDGEARELAISSETTAETIYYPPSMTQTESYQLSKSTTTAVTDDSSYQAGTYAVGTDIPAGLYLAVSDNEFNPDGFFSLDVYNRPVVKGSNMRNINTIDWWQNYGYVELEDGQSIKLSWANLYPADETDIHPDPWQTCGMFRVGVDIEPGTYLLTGNSDDGIGQYFIYDSAKADANLIKEDYCYTPDRDNSAEITLHDGEYLLTMFSIITEKLEEELPEGAFRAGTYEVHEPGLYVALADVTAKNGSFRLDVYDSPEMENLLIGGLVQNCRYVELEEHQAIDFADAVLYPADSVTMPDPYVTPGMYRAGYDFQPGTCKVKATSTVSGMVIVYDSAGQNATPLISKQLKDGSAEIEIHDGEFLEMRNCILEK